MKINRIYIKDFGGISDKEYLLDNGFNVIFGENESGKSTFLSFFRFIFYGAKKSKGKELSFYEKYMPWNGQPMCGEAEFTLNGNIYFLSRTISPVSKQQTVTFINKTTGDTIDKNDDIGAFIFKMSETAFLKTLFIGAEGTRISSDGEILTKISNISQSGDEKTSYRAIGEKINKLISDLSSPRKTNAVIPILESKIQELETKKAESENLYVKKSLSEKKHREISDELDEAFKSKADLENHRLSLKKHRYYTLYKNAVSNLDEAEATYNSSLNSVSDCTDILKSIPPEEETIILKDNSAYIAQLKMQKVLLTDKSKTSRISGFFALLALTVCAIAGFIYHLVLWSIPALTVISAALLINSKSNFKKSSEIDEEISSLEDKKRCVLKKYNLESTEHYKMLKREFTKNDNGSNLKLIAENNYRQRKSELDELTNEIISIFGSTDNLKSEKTELTEKDISDKLKKLDETIIYLTQEKTKLEENLKSYDGLAEQIEVFKKEIENLSAELNEAKENLSVLNLATDILNESFEEMKMNFAPKLAKSTAKIFNSITGENYGDITVNDDFDIRIKTKENYKISNFFSSGTIQQLYFSLRLGIIELILGNYPLFIDDAFVYYDDMRFKNASEYLKAYSSENQIIFCTCHKRESEIDGACVIKF